MKRLFTILLLFVASLSSFAQLSKIPQRNEIVSIEADEDVADPDFLSTLSKFLNGGVDIREVFDAPSSDGAHHYWLTVGHLGFGDDIVQVMIDPAFELFIPLGDTLEEAQKTIESIHALFKQPKNSSMEVQGCLCLAFPDKDKLETVTVTYRKPLLSKMLEFTIRRGDLVRSSHVQKTDFGSLVSGVKWYRKLHPKE